MSEEILIILLVASILLNIWLFIYIRIQRSRQLAAIKELRRLLIRAAEIRSQSISNMEGVVHGTRVKQ